MATTEDAWYEQERRILDLRRRVEALEQRAAAPAPEPAPAPAADQPLWKHMHLAYYAFSDTTEAWVAVLHEVADWLDAREHCGAASALRVEARRAREGA